MERKEELEAGLIGLMKTLGISKVRAMVSLAIIRAENLHYEMVEWIVNFRDREDNLTAQAFMSKLHELTDCLNTQLISR